MKFMLLIYNDKTLLDDLPAPEYDARMRDCITHADELRGEGYLLDSRQAVRIAAEFPWARTGCVEVRPVRDFDTVRRRVGADSSRTGTTP